MKVYYELVQLPGNERVPGTEVVRIKVPDENDVGDLVAAVYKLEEPLVKHCGLSQLGAYPPRTDTGSPNFKQRRLQSDSPIPSTTQDTPLRIAFPADDSLVNKRKLEALLQTTQIALSESGTKKSIELAKVKPTKRCFLCNSTDSIEASHVFQKSDISYKSQPQSDTVLKTLQVLDNWMKDPKWKRPFEIHGSMNLIWLCHQHNIDFDHHAFCLRVDISNRVIFHAFDENFRSVVESANSRLLDPNQVYFNLDYVSRRAVGMRVLQSQNRANKYVDHTNPKSWEAVVDLSLAASERGDSEEDSDEA